LPAPLGLGSVIDVVGCRTDGFVSACGRLSCIGEGFDFLLAFWVEGVFFFCRFRDCDGIFCDESGCEFREQASEATDVFDAVSDDYIKYFGGFTMC